MRRYIDFQGDDWTERTDSRMQAARWAACVEGIDDRPALAGVIDTYPDEVLADLIGEGWTLPPPSQTHDTLQEAAREAAMATLSDDVDCLGVEEHTLVERMLIGTGTVALESVAEMEAAYTLRMRLWCDLGFEGETAVARLDEGLREALPPLLMRAPHQERRARIFIYDGMLNGMLYAAGFLDDRLPRAKFIDEVLQAEDTPENQRLARNYLEASFDTYPVAGCNLLLHEALADPDTLAGVIGRQGAFQMPQLTPGEMAGSMNGLLPQEAIPDEKLQRALNGALRPEFETYEAASDLRFLAKQDAPIHTLQEIMASMLFVLPTPHMDGALREMRHHTPRWVRRDALRPPPGMEGDSAIGQLH